MAVRVYDHREHVDENDYSLYDAPDELDVVSLFFDIEKNRFIDEDGYIVWDIYNYITPNDMYLFRHELTSMFIRHRSLKNTLCELYYPELDEEEDW